MSTRFEGVGVTARELRPGTVVMVPVGQLNALVNGGPCVIAWAVVTGRAGLRRRRGPLPDPSEMWWLDVYLGSGTPPLPQMYRADAILGVPAPGLRMDGARGLDGPRHQGVDDVGNGETVES